jgi:hypothetical protein
VGVENRILCCMQKSVMKIWPQRRNEAFFIHALQGSWCYWRGLFWRARTCSKRARTPTLSGCCATNLLRMSIAAE